MTLPDAAENHLTNITLDWSPSVIAVGMGMGQHPDSVASIENLLTEKNFLMLLTLMR